jgi:tyrosine-protein kinase Etk/Wzc
MNEIQGNLVNIQEEESIDIKKWIRKILSNWYWFGFFGFIGIVLGYGYSRIAQEEYEVNSLILAESNESKGGMSELFSSEIFGTNTNLMNHIGTLKSYSFIRQTLINLDWRIQWHEEKYLKVADLYKNAPFTVKEETGYLNVPQVQLQVTPLDDKTYRISVDDEVWFKGKKTNISFEKQGRYGEVFSNNYFNFVLEKTDFRLIDPESNYYFTFKDLNTQAISYKGRIEVSAYDEESDIIQLKLVGGHPQRASDFLNQLIDDYISYGLHKKNQISDNTILFIDKQLGGIVDSLRTAGDQFTSFRSRNRIVDLSQEAGLAVEQLKELEYEESLVKMRYDYYKNLQTYLDDAKQMEHIVAPSVVGITDPSLNALVLKLSELYSTLNTVSSSMTEINPARIAIEDEIDYTKQILDENLKSLISNVSIQLQNFENRKQTLNYQLTVLPKTEQNLINYKRKFDINNELYTFLMQKSAEAAITKASNVPDVQVLDYAAVETAEFRGPNKKLFLIIGLLGGLAVPFFLLVLIDFFNTTVNGKDEIERFSHLPVIGTIVTNKLRNELPIVKQPHSGISESIRALRTNLNFILDQEKCSIVSVHSSVPKEGKTFLSANLATSIAINGRKVLLVSTDLRKPKIDKIFNTQNQKGLTNFIIKKSSFDEIIEETQIKNLFFVSSGPIPPNPAELLGTEMFIDFLSRAKEQFDYIVLDNAPAFMVTDPIIVGNLSDINLYVVRQGYTKKDNLKVINEFDSKKTLKKLYLVLNDVKGNASGYNKMYSKGYGHFNRAGKIDMKKAKRVSTNIQI